MSERGQPDTREGVRFGEAVQARLDFGTAVAVAVFVVVMGGLALGIAVRAAGEGAVVNQSLQLAMHGHWQPEDCQQQRQNGAQRAHVPNIPDWPPGSTASVARRGLQFTADPRKVADGERSAERWVPGG